MVLAGTAGSGSTSTNGITVGGCLALRWGFRRTVTVGGHNGGFESSIDPNKSRKWKKSRNGEKKIRRLYHGREGSWPGNGGFGRRRRRSEGKESKGAGGRKNGGNWELEACRGSSYWVRSWGVGRTTFDDQLVRLISFCQEFLYPSYYDFFFLKSNICEFYNPFILRMIYLFYHHVVILSIPLYQ